MGSNREIQKNVWKFDFPKDFFLKTNFYNIWQSHDELRKKNTECPTVTLTLSEGGYISLYYNSIDWIDIENVFIPGLHDFIVYSDDVMIIKVGHDYDDDQMMSL